MIAKRERESAYRDGVGKELQIRGMLLRKKLWIRDASSSRRITQAAGERGVALSLGKWFRPYITLRTAGVSTSLSYLGTQGRY